MQSLHFMQHIPVAISIVGCTAGSRMPESQQSRNTDLRADQVLVSIALAAPYGGGQAIDKVTVSSFGASKDNRTFDATSTPCIVVPCDKNTLYTLQYGFPEGVFVSTRPSLPAELNSAGSFRSPSIVTIAVNCNFPPTEGIESITLELVPALFSVPTDGWVAVGGNPAETLSTSDRAETKFTVLRGIYWLRAVETHHRDEAFPRLAGAEWAIPIIDARRQNKELRYVVEKQPTTVVGGTVTDANGIVSVGATVWMGVADEHHEDRVLWLRSVKTSSGGEFSMHCSARSETIMLWARSHTGSSGAPISVQVPGVENVGQGTSLVVRQGAPMEIRCFNSEGKSRHTQIRVKSASGVLLPVCRIEREWWGSAKPISSEWASSQEFPVLAAGDYMVECIEVDGRVHSKSVRVENQTKPVTIVM